MDADALWTEDANKRSASAAPGRSTPHAVRPRTPCSALACPGYIPSGGRSIHACGKPASATAEGSIPLRFPHWPGRPALPKLEPLGPDGVKSGSYAVLRPRGRPHAKADDGSIRNTRHVFMQVAEEPCLRHAVAARSWWKRVAGAGFAGTSCGRQRGPGRNGLPARSLTGTRAPWKRPTASSKHAEATGGMSAERAK
jgi:hypothetical protein